MPRDVRFFDKTRQDMQWVGPGKYNVRETDNQNSKLRGSLCSTIFGRKPMNLEARSNPQEYIMVGHSIKHTPAYKNAPPRSKSSLRKRVHQCNELAAAVSVPDIFYANLDKFDVTIEKKPKSPKLDTESHIKNAADGQSDAHEPAIDLGGYGYLQ